MNPRQRRGILLVGLAVVGAVAVFVAVANFVADIRSQVGPMAEAVALSDELPPQQEITADLLDTMEMPERWMPSRAVTNPQDVVGQVSSTGLAAGTVLQEGMVTSPGDLEAGQRELAIMVDAETGVGGKITRGSIVDIYATFPGEQTGDQQVPPRASIVVQNALILDVGAPTTQAEETATGFEGGDVLPVTFALSIDESLRLAYIESFAAKVRLALRAPLDEEAVDPDQRTYQPLILDPDGHIGPEQDSDPEPGPEPDPNDEAEQ